MSSPFAAQFHESFRALSRGPTRYRDMLLETGTEELAHIDMPATAVALNLEGAPLEQDKAAADPMVMAAMGGMNVQHVITSCMAAMPVDASGVPFNCSHVYASGNTAADMLANATAESTGRMLACQLWKMTSDPGMKDNPITFRSQTRRPNSPIRS